MAGLAQAGAAAGTAIMPGIGTAVGGLAGALADTFMGGAGGSSSAPQNSQTAVYGSGLDGSGWAVNIGKGTQTATSAPASAAGINPADSLGSMASSALGGFNLGGIPNWFWFAAVGVVLWKKSR